MMKGNVSVEYRSIHALILPGRSKYILVLQEKSLKYGTNFHISTLQKMNWTKNVFIRKRTW